MAAEKSKQEVRPDARVNKQTMFLDFSLLCKLLEVWPVIHSQTLFS